MSTETTLSNRLVVTRANSACAQELVNHRRPIVASGDADTFFT